MMESNLGMAELERLLTEAGGRDKVRAARGADGTHGRGAARQPRRSARAPASRPSVAPTAAPAAPAARPGPA
jgi:hypothetical protein